MEVSRRLKLNRSAFLAYMYDYLRIIYRLNSFLRLEEMAMHIIDLNILSSHNLALPGVVIPTSTVLGDNLELYQCAKS